jgi:hypothetical protein
MAKKKLKSFEVTLHERCDRLLRKTFTAANDGEARRLAEADEWTDANGWDATDGDGPDGGFYEIGITDVEEA